MQIAWSANRTCELYRSASEYTATVLISSSLQALMTRTAISPRLAMRTLLNRMDGKQSLPVLHRLPVHDQLAFDYARRLRLDLVHQFHGLDNAEDLAGLHVLADAHERRRVRRRAFVKRAHDGRLHQNQVGIDGSWLLGRLGSGGRSRNGGRKHLRGGQDFLLRRKAGAPDPHPIRSEERRVGKECRSRWPPYH